ncbi:hypothetical protein ACWPKO_08815 [Coraliomargarita sp. W4R53]
MILELFLSGTLIIFGVLYGFWLYRNSTKVVFGDISILMAVLFFGAGSWLSFIFGYRWENEYNSALTTILSFLGVYLFILGLSVSSRLFCPRELNLNVFTFGGHRSSLFYFPVRADVIRWYWIILSIAVVWGLRLYTFSLGGGVSSTDTFEVIIGKPYPIVVFETLFKPLNYVVLMYALVQLFRPKHKNYLWVVYLLSEIAYLALQGRRDLFEFAVIILFCTFSIYKKVSLKMLVLTSVFVISIFTVFSPMFLVFREVVRAESQGFNETSIYKSIQVAISDLSDVDSLRLEERSASNIQGRARANIRWVNMVTSGHLNDGVLMGKVAFSGAMSVLPRFLRPYQFWGDNALVIQSKYGFGYGDIADNYVANGIADFSLMGALMWGLVIGSTLNFLYARALKLEYENPLFAALLFVWLWNFAINTEASITTYFALWRGVILLWVLGGIVSMLGISTGWRGTRAIMARSAK